MSFKADKHRSRSRLSAAFHADLFADWLENGKDVIRHIRETEPLEYAKIIAAMVKTVDVNVAHIDEEMAEVRSRDQLYEFVRVRGGERAVLALEQFLGEPVPNRDNVIDLQAIRKDDNDDDRAS